MPRKLLLYFVLILGCSAWPLSAHFIDKQEAYDFLSSLESLYLCRYAPADWKKSRQQQWDISSKINEIKQQIANQDDMSVRDFQRAVKQFFLFFKDYHVGVCFHSTEKASLPFQIKGFGGRYFVSSIDRDKLSEFASCLEVGDEVLSFDGRSPGELIAELVSLTPSANGPTDNALAEMILTNRSARLGHTVPKGSLVVEYRSHSSGEVFGHQFLWDYTTEMISNYDLLVRQSFFQPKLFDPERLKSERAYTHLLANDECTIGGRVSFLPRLGQELWSTDEDHPFDAYLTEGPDQQIIGVVRIPHYQFDSEDIEKFRVIIEKMEKKADLLVIDQLNNSGGNLFTLYAFASMLTKRPLVTPKEHILLSQEDVMTAYQELELLELTETEEDAQIVLPFIAGGSHQFSSLQLCLFAKEYCRFLIDQWREGKVMTDLTHIYGIDYVNPHPTTRFTKPIIVLVNELAFSCGDFFPAIMQDNDRALLVGSRTAGAGGFVVPHRIANRLGVAYFTITGSLGKRPGGNPIEDLGVTPDIELTPNVNDLRTDYDTYRHRLWEIIEQKLADTKMPSTESLGTK